MKRSALRRRTPLQSRPRRGRGFNSHYPKSWLPEMRRFKAAVLAPGICVVCKEAKPCDAHHVLAQRAIRRYVSGLRGLDSEKREALLVKLLFDERNGLSVCRKDHDAHETAGHRIPQSLLPAAAWDFARELGLDWQLELYYPADSGGGGE